MSVPGFSRVGADNRSLRSLAKVAIDVADAAGADQRVVSTMRQLLARLSTVENDNRGASK